MRIEGPKSTSEIKKSEKTRKSSGSGGVFSAMLEDEGASSAPQLRGASPMAGIGNLLAVQGADDPAESKRRKKMMERAHKVLDALGQVHKGLVQGNLSPADMNDVSRAVREGRESVDDPRLTEILNEVDLRAQVELAKMELAREKGHK